MVEEGFGHVINVSSIWGKAGPSNRSAYSSAKFAIIGLMDCVRNEVLVLIKVIALIVYGQSLNTQSC